MTSRSDRRTSISLTLTLHCLVLLLGCSESSDDFGNSLSPAVLRTASPKTPAVRCDKFAIVEEVHGDSVGIRLATDLPPDTTIMVSVSRSYREVGEPNIDYSIDYLSEKSTVAAWCKMKYISISDAVWESSLKAKQREMDSYGLGFRVASTDETIDIRFVVPVNQLHPRFDKNNLNLTGVAVEGTKSKHCRAEKTFMKPLRHCKILEAELAAKASGAQTRHRPTLDEFMLTVNHDALKECVIQQGLLGTVAPIWLDRCADFAMYAEYLGTTKNGAKEKFADAIVNCTSASDLTRRLSR